MAQATRWHLDRSEVRHGTNTSTSGGRSKARQSRARDVRALTMFLVHEPTGVRVEGEIPAGSYARRDMKLQSDAL
jgi:hypothetical protein